MRPQIDQISPRILPGGPREAQKAGRQGPEREKQTSGAPAGRKLHQKSTKNNHKFTKNCVKHVAEKGRTDGQEKGCGSDAITEKSFRSNGKVVWGECGRKDATVTPLWH